MNAVVIVLFIGGATATLPIFTDEVKETNPCQDKSNGYTLPAPGSSTDYYLCINERHFILTCGTMYFNPQTHACEVPEEVSKVHMCDKRANGYKIASTDSCSEYFVCMSEVPLTRTCGWMHFDAKLGKCIDFRFSSCKIEKLNVNRRLVIKYQGSGDMMVPVLLHY